MAETKNIRLELYGHRDFYNLQDVVRLFYGLSILHETAEPAYLDVTLSVNSKLYNLLEQGEVKLISAYDQANETITAKLLLADKCLLVKSAKVADFKLYWAEVMHTFSQSNSAEQATYIATIEDKLVQALLTPKRLVKKLLYDLLCEIEGLCFPWGSLTGIRPTYMATEIYQCLYNWRALLDYKLAKETAYTLEPNLANLSENACLSKEMLANLSTCRLAMAKYDCVDLWQIVSNCLQSLYGLSVEKAELVCKTASNENKLLARACYKPLTNKVSTSSSEKVGDIKLAVTKLETTKLASKDERLLSIYIGIPFCFTRCAYCSFAPRDGIKAKTELVTAYVTALIKELQTLWPLIRGKIQTLYIGGGTPSALDEANLERLCNCLTSLPMWNEISEKTFEAGRADTITRTKLEIVRQAGFQHVCVNPQSFNVETLKHLGRPAYADEIKNVMQMVRDLKFPVCNMDLIFGLPGEKRQDMLYSLEQALSFAPENITIHTLAFKRKSWLGQLRNSERSVPETVRQDSTLQAFAHGLNQLQFVQSELHQTLTDGQNLLQAHAYLPYYMYRQKDAVSALENTGFARPVKLEQAGTSTYSLGNLYNVLMMLDQTSILGFGCCAMSKFVNKSQVERFSNARSVASYLENSEAHSLAKAKLIERYFGA